MVNQSKSQYLDTKWFKKFFTWPLEGAVAWVVVNTLKLLPIDMASGLMGFIARNLGPHLSVSNRARINIRNVFRSGPKAGLKMF